MKEPLKECKVCGGLQRPMSRNANCWKFGVCSMCHHEIGEVLTPEEATVQRRLYNPVDFYWDLLTLREMRKI